MKQPTGQSVTEQISIKENSSRTILRNLQGIHINLPFFHYITKVLLMGLSLILLPLDPGAESFENSSYPPMFRDTQNLSIAKDSTVGSGLNHEDDILAALTIYFEAKGESFAGKLAVAAVIRNRMAHRFHSDGTVRGTVLSPKQFQPWITRNPDMIPFNSTDPKMRESLLAWKLVQDGRKVVDGAVLFYNPQIVKTPRWARVHRKVAQIGGHEFFHTEKI